MPQAFRYDLMVGDEEWDLLMDSSPLGNVFLHSGVLRDLAKRERPEASILRVGARNADGSLAGGWAVLKRRRGPVRYASSFPLFYAGPVLGPAWQQDDQREAAVMLLHGLAKRLTAELDILDTEASPDLRDVRGALYAGCEAQQVYAHLWPQGAAEEVARWPNRSKRRSIQQARGQYVFDWQKMEPASLEHFDDLHYRTIEKFRWHAPASWRQALIGNMTDLARKDICRLFSACPPGSPPAFDAAVTVLLSRPQKAAWLWRVAYAPRHDGLVPSLYVSAAEAVKREFGPEWTVNFGGSPRLSLSLFKDFLGAVPAPHWRIRWRRPGLRGILCGGAQVLRESFRRRRFRLPP